MKAAQLSQYGKAHEAVVINDIPVPEVGEGKVLVEVRAAGVNPFDYKVQLGYMKDSMPLQLPITLGGDLAGIVTEVGEGVTDFKPGDEVYGQGSAVGGGTGSFAEFDLTKPTSITRKPEKLTFIEAGGAPLTGVSALQAITEHIDLKNGDKILIHGGAGGIGSVAIQIAKNLGAHVTTTVSIDDFSFVKTLGADEVIDYKNQRFEEVVSDMDAVFDTVGKETNKRSYQVLKKDGILVSMVEQPDETLAKQYEIKALVQSTKVTTARLNKLAELLEQGIITINTEKTFPLDQAADALAYLHDTPPKGKVVIEIKA